MNTDDVQQEQEAASPFRFKAALIGIGLLVVGLVVYLQFSSGSRVDPTRKGTPEGTPVAEDDRQAALDIFQRETHQSACMNALKLLNDHLGRARAPQVASLSAAEKSLLQETAKLTPDEQSEVEQTTFGVMDSHYLDSCFLLHDAARLLEVWPNTASASERPDPVARARAAFAWVVRQIKLSGPAHRDLDFLQRPPLTRSEQIYMPPQFALRVGGETCWDRALVFLGLLDQLGMEEAAPTELLGCLVVCPDDKENLRLWACGVLIGRDIYLFDPELGLPLPGPDGKGVATLADVRKDPKKLLAPLNVSDRVRYDIKPEQAARATVYLAPPLLSLAPRMRWLQDEVLSSITRIRLAHDLPRELDRVQAANGVEKGSVRPWGSAMTVLRRFLPKSEGGADAGQQVMARSVPGVRGFASAWDDSRVYLTLPIYVRLRLVPWSFLPSEIRNNEQIPATKSLGLAFRKSFETPFVQSALEPGHARDLFLRGNLSQAVNELTQERDVMETYLLHLRAFKDVRQEADTWLREAVSVRARMLRARSGSADEQAQLKEKIEEMDKKSEPVTALLQGALAVPRLVELAYLLGQCKMEQAERLQAHLDYAQHAGGKLTREEKDEVDNAWASAQFWWKKYLEDYPDSPNAPRARLHQARTLAVRGKKAEAARVLRDLAGVTRPSDALAHLYLAQQLEKAPPG